MAKDPKPKTRRISVDISGNVECFDHQHGGLVALELRFHLFPKLKKLSGG